MEVPKPYTLNLQSKAQHHHPLRGKGVDTIVSALKSKNPRHVGKQIGLLFSMFLPKKGWFISESCFLCGAAAALFWRGNLGKLVSKVPAWEIARLENFVLTP